MSRAERKIVDRIVGDAIIRRAMEHDGVVAPRLTKGDRVEMIEQPDEADPIPEGSLGTVERVSDVDLGGGQRFTQLSVAWDDGRSLMAVMPPDRCREGPPERGRAMSAPSDYRWARRLTDEEMDELERESAAGAVIRIMTLGLEETGSSWEAEASIDPRQFAIPDFQWRRLAEATSRKATPDRSVANEMLSIWVNKGPSGYRPEAGDR